MPKNHYLAILAASLLTLGGCNDKTGDDSNTAANGTLHLSIMDGPVENAEKVVVEFTGVVIKPADGNQIVINFDEPKSIDLLQLQHGKTADLLDGTSLRAGHYNWIRLMVNAENNQDDTYITVAGVNHELEIPSSPQTGLKLVSGFTITAGGHHHFTIDFDLRKSIVHNTQGYKLKPTLRLIDSVQTGTISGEVDGTVLSDNNCGTSSDVAAAVYIYNGHNVIADDIYSPTEPLASANVVYMADSSSYRYKAVYVPTGDYTVALTCEAGKDAADKDDDIAFISSKNTTVTFNSTQTVNF